MEKKEQGCEHLEKIARSHSKSGYDIKPHLYDLWLDSLIDTVQKCDPLFSPSVEEAWRKVMEMGIEYMKSEYEKK